MSTVIVDELAAVVTELQAAGIPATSDPALVWALASQADVAALLGWPEDVSLAFNKNQVRFTVPVQLCSRGPDLQAQPRLLGALPAALRVLKPQSAAAPDQISQGDSVMPAYRIASPRTIGC